MAENLRRVIHLRRRSSIPAPLILILALTGARPLQAWSQDEPPLPEAVADDGPVYHVGRIVLRLVNRGHPGVPTRDRLMQLEISVGRTSSGYVAPREGVASVHFTLASIEQRQSEPYHASALQTIFERIQGHLSARDLAGVRVRPDPEHIDGNGADLRPEGQTSLRVEVTVAIVSEVRTIGSGERVASDATVNNPRHERIARLSPSRPHEPGDDKRRDLINRTALDLYLARLSRHPGRRVDAAVSSSGEPGSLVLDYLVAEGDPLLTYSQLSNTGTDQTDRLRARFGLIHSQLTDRDDILSLDYVTSFNRVNGVVGSYEFPMPDIQGFRARVGGNWSSYTASDVGIQRDIFKGEVWWLQGDLIYNFLHERINEPLGAIFGDLVVGVKYEQDRVENQLALVTGDQDFTLPHLGVRFEQRRNWYAWNANLLLEWNANRVDPIQTSRLGRLFPDLNFGVLRWDLGGTFFLEPILNRDAWSDPSTPSSSTLAHEIAASFRGQYAFENRLVPQQQIVMGGLYTVRGYPQSVAAGDSGLIGNLEYRFHLPRLLEPQPEPGRLFGSPFRFVPDRIYGQADWDLIFKSFIDVGHTIISDKVSFENESTLVGGGLGLEFQYQRRLNLRLDWGVALHGIDAGDVHAGSNRFYFSTTWYF